MTPAGLTRLHRRVDRFVLSISARPRNAFVGVVVTTVRHYSPDEPPIYYGHLHTSNDWPDYGTSLNSLVSPVSRRSSRHYPAQSHT